MPEKISQYTKEKIETTLTIDDDPTGGAVNWSFTDADISDADPDPGKVAGEWDGVYADGEVVTASPTLGNGTAQIPLTANRYTIWVQFAVGSENPFVPIDFLTVS